uniref:Titin n=1 Tax=Parascaris univalens TaxID=6257 RepID=A0A914ZQC4_PARUN
MEGREKRASSPDASASEEPKRLKLEEKENWTTVTVVHSSGAQSPSSILQRDATTSYATNRETVYHKNARTIEETHLIKSTGSSNEGFSEEHWTSEIKSYITTQPPKFVQVIRAFRVLATDTLTLVVEVESDPPAIFEWFCNDRPVQQDRRRFKVRHGINITTLTVEGPEQGVYKCTARNPAGISTTYGYITVNAPPQYKKWVEQKHAVVIEEKVETVSSERIGITIRQAPKFVNQVPNLTLKPGVEAVIDVEVEASPPAKFTWFVNGFELRDSSGRLEVYYPKENRCVARFPIPQSGEYKVIAENSVGRDQSIGYVDVKKEVSVHRMQRPPLPAEHMRHADTSSAYQHRDFFERMNKGRASSVTKNYEVYEESSYYQRSTSLPRPMRGIEKHIEVSSNADLLRRRQEETDATAQYSSTREIATQREDDHTETLYRTTSESFHFLPQAPLFVSALPKDVHLSSNEKLVLSVDVKASPPAKIAWKLDGTEVVQSESVSLLDEHNRSTLVVQPPVQQGLYTVTAKNKEGESTLSTSVHRVEEETFVQVDEQMVLSNRWITTGGRSTPPEIVDNAITVTTASDGWEIVEEADALKSSADSFETVKLADGVRLSVGRDEDRTPKSHTIPRVRTSTFAQTVSEERRTSLPHPTIITSPKSSEDIETFATEVIEERRLVPPYLPRRSTERLPQRPFVVRQPPPEVFVKAGEKLVLYSKVDSHPESSFKWYHNNFELRPSATTKIESSAPNESRATFERPTDGIYKVTAANLYGSCSSSTRVVTEVVEKTAEESFVSVVRLPQPQTEPKFQLMRKGRFESRNDLPKAPEIKRKFAALIRVPQKQPLVLSIEADAIPEATFTWRVNNFEVRTSALVHIERPAPNVSQATFTKPAEGKYEVIAANELGSVTCSTKVAVDYEAEVASEKKTVVSLSQIVQKPPTFVQPLPAETRLSSSNEELHLAVVVDSQQPVTFRWFADGSLLSNSIEHQMINEAFKSELLIRRRISHPTDYAVEVSNNYGTIWSETRVGPPTVTKTSTTVEELLATEAVTEVQQKAPRFTTPLYPIEVEEGDRFTAKVIVDQDGLPCEFLWYMNGKDLRTLPGFRVDSTHYESTLIADSTTTRNSGRLSVVARNECGAAESSATISVNEKEESFEVITTTASIPPERPPKIIVPLHSTVFRSGEPMVLRCRIDAVPPAQITWSKDEIDLAEWVISENITATVLPDGTYELSKPQCTTEDAGLYQCSARNAHGKAETAAYVTVEEAVSATDVHETEIHKTTVTKSPSPYIPQEPPKFTESMEAVDEGYETLLMCKLHSEAPVEISWYHDGILLQQCDKHTMGSMADGTQILTIRNVVKEDEGVYICRAESRYGVAETCTQIKATREKKQTSVEEVMIEEHDDEQIQIPQRTEFRKKAYTDTTVKVVAETEITSSEENYSRTAELRKSEEAYKLLVKVAETVASRLVAKVVIDEAIREAVYRIREETRTSDEEEIFYETIDIEEQLSAPRFETNIECYNVRAGDTVRLATDVRGHPTPTVEWYFGQQRIQQSSRTEVLYSNGRSTLLIKKATKADEGTYYCHAENRFGKSVLSCDLRVIDISKDRTQSTLDFSKAKYVSSESESEVFSNVHVNHSEETFEHHIAFLQPQTIALGYDCRASTSKVCDDSVIIRRETVAVTSEQLIPTEKEVTLNVNVEKPAPQFTHDVRILQPNEGGAFLISKEKRVVRSEEVMQTTDITLSEPQRIAHGADSTVNTSATIVIEKPTQRVLHEVTCLYDDRISLPEQRFHAVTSVEITQLQAVNELLSSVLARKDEHLAYEVANVEVRRPPSKFDHTTTVVECEIAHITAYFTAPTTATEEIIVVELSLSKCSQVRSEEITQIEQPIRRAFGEQRIVILEGSAQSFSEAVTWSLRRVRKAASISGEALTNANIEVRKPSERGEHVTTFIDSSTIMQEILAIAAAATKMKITSVFITLTKKGEVAHQALVVEYESFVQEEAALNIALLTVPAVHLKQEETWTRETKIVETHGEGNVVAVFVEVDANCPDQSVELVASVSVPVLSNENLLEVQKSSYSILEKSASISESSSLGILQAPKFLKKLKNVTSIIGNALQFKCIVSGTPMPEVRWFVDGDEIHSSVEYETVYEDGVCILRINEVVSEDEGEYTCEATNAAGRATTKCFLHTAREMVAEETLVPVGASASIHCETITQQFSLKWQKDRRPLSVDERYESSDSADGYKHTLTIHGVRQGDEGEYGVIIADSYTAVTRITVIDSDYQFMRGEEAYVSQHIDVPLRPVTIFGEVTVNVAEEHEAIVYDEYEICDSHEYFDLHFRTQSIEVPVVVRERRSESMALFYDSRESSAATMEEKVVDIEIIHRETSATSDEFIEQKKALIETALSSIDTHYEFTRWQKAVQEVVVSESRNIKALRAMSVESTDNEVSIECAPFYGRVTMVKKTLAPTPCESASIHFAERLVDVDLSFSRAHDVSTAEDSLSTSSQGLPYTQPHFIQRLSEVYELDEEMSFTFKCIIGGVPTPSVRWLINDNLISEDSNVSMVAEDGIYLLKTKSLNRSWNGTLVCEASNSLGSMRSTSNIVIKTVQQLESVCELYAAEQKYQSEVKVVTNAFDSVHRVPLKCRSPDASELSTTSSATSSAGQPPVFQQPLTDTITVKTGELIQLKCVLSGNPLPACQWTKDGVSVEESSENAIIYEDGIAILRIHSASMTDNASFRCTATNTFGCAYSECTVFVEEDSTRDSSVSQGPYFVLPLKDLTVNVNERLQLKCIVAGNPIPTIRWKLNGREIHEDEKRFKMVYEDGTVLLKMTETVETGVFTCEAVNSLGYAKTECRIEIQQPSQATVEMETMSEQREKSEKLIPEVTRTKKAKKAEAVRKEERILASVAPPLETAIKASAVNYIVEADVIIFTVFTYKTKATVKVKGRSKRVDENFMLIFVIEENILRKKSYAQVVERRFKIVRIYGEGNERVIASGELGRSLEQVRNAIEAFIADEKRKGIKVEGENLERVIEILRVPRISQTSQESEQGHEEFEKLEVRHHAREESQTFYEGCIEKIERIQRRTFVIEEEHIPRPEDEELTVTDVNCVCEPAVEFVEADVLVRSFVKDSVTVHVTFRHGPSAGTTETFFEVVTEGWVTHKTDHARNTPTAPRFTRPFSVAKTLHDMYELRCTVAGHPAPDIRILHNGTPIRCNDRDYRVIYECGIIILRMRRLREGHYVCRATNVSGSAVTECYLKADDGLGDVFEVDRLSSRFGTSQFQTESATSHVDVTGQDSIHQAFLYPAFIFREPTSSDTQRFSRREMLFERTTGSEQTKNETKKLHAETGVGIHFDSFDSNRKEDRRMQEVFTSTATDVAYSTLDHRTSRELHGNATAVKGDSLQLLQEAPVFALPLADIVTEPVNFLELKCIVTGYPRPAIRWTFNDQEIHPGSSATVVYEDGIILLELSGANIEGHYTCTAKNEAGYAKTECNVCFKKKVGEEKTNGVQYFEQGEVDGSIAEGKISHSFQEQQKHARSLEDRHAEFDHVSEPKITEQTVGKWKEGAKRFERLKLTQEIDETCPLCFKERAYITVSEESTSLDLIFGQITSADTVEVDMVMHSTGRTREQSERNEITRLLRQGIEDFSEDISVKKNTVTATMEVAVVEKVVASVKWRVCEGSSQESSINQIITSRRKENVEVLVSVIISFQDAACLFINHQPHLGETHPFLEQAVVDGSATEETIHIHARAPHRQHESNRQQDLFDRTWKSAAKTVVPYRGIMMHINAEEGIGAAESSTEVLSIANNFLDVEMQGSFEQYEKAVGTNGIYPVFFLDLSAAESTYGEAHRLQEESREESKVFDIVGKKLEENAAVSAFFGDHRGGRKEADMTVERIRAEELVRKPSDSIFNGISVTGRTCAGTTQPTQAEIADFAKEQMISELPQNKMDSNVLRIVGSGAASAALTISRKMTTADVGIFKEKVTLFAGEIATEGGDIGENMKQSEIVEVDSEATVEKSQEVSNIEILLNESDFATGTRMVTKGVARTVSAEENLSQQSRLVKDLRPERAQEENKDVLIVKNSAVAFLTVTVIESMFPTTRQFLSREEVPVKCSDIFRKDDSAIGLFIRNLSSEVLESAISSVFPTTTGKPEIDKAIQSQREKVLEETITFDIAQNKAPVAIDGEGTASAQSAGRSPLLPDDLSEKATETSLKEETAEGYMEEVHVLTCAEKVGEQDKTGITFPLFHMKSDAQEAEDVEREEMITTDVVLNAWSGNYEEEVKVFIQTIQKIGFSPTKDEKLPKNGILEKGITDEVKDGRTEELLIELQIKTTAEPALVEVTVVKTTREIVNLEISRGTHAKVISHQKKGQHLEEVTLPSHIQTAPDTADVGVLQIALRTAVHTISSCPFVEVHASINIRKAEDFAESSVTVALQQTECTAEEAIKLSKEDTVVAEVVISAPSSTELVQVGILTEVIEKDSLSVMQVTKALEEAIGHEKIVEEMKAEAFEEVLLEVVQQKTPDAGVLEVSVAEIMSLTAGHTISKRPFEEAYVDIDVCKAQEVTESSVTVALQQTESAIERARMFWKEESVFAEAVVCVPNEESAIEACILQKVSEKCALFV